MKSVLSAFMAVMMIATASAFAPVVPQAFRSVTQQTLPSNNYYMPAALQQQRKSVANVQTMGLFGLGAPEIAIILVAAAFVLGPQKLAELGKDAGKIAGELKEVPKEFQKGLQEGESNANKLKQAPPASVDVEQVEEKQKD